MIVVDANVIAYLVIRGEHSRLADLVAHKDPDWSAPVLWRSELLNVLSTYLRSSLLSPSIALSLFNEAEVAVKAEVTPESRDVIELAVSSRCSSYDCEYIAVARTLDVPLVTADKLLLRTFPELAISMSDFVNAA